MVLLQQLLTTISFRSCEPVVDAVEPCNMKTPIKVRLLLRIWQALDIQDGLIHLNSIGKDVVGNREVVFR